jgi:hypothetical protein
MRWSLLVTLLVPSLAAAHVRITSPTPRSSTSLKERHCGAAGSTRAHVQTMRPGSSLHLVWDEYIEHPGWFRVAFQKTGDVFEVPSPSNGPMGTGAASNYPTENLTGMTDAATGSLIIADRIAHGTLSLDITLPNVECNNCTLQLTQMMTDKPPYTADASSNDIYYACVDLVLSASAPDAGPTGPTPTPEPAASEGCSTTAAPSAILGLAALGLLRRRRASRHLLPGHR